MTTNFKEFIGISSDRKPTEATELYDFMFDDKTAYCAIEDKSLGYMPYTTVKPACMNGSATMSSSVSSTSPDDFDVYFATADTYFDFMSAPQYAMDDSVPLCPRPVYAKPIESVNTAPHHCPPQRPSHPLSFSETRKTRKRRKSNEIDRKFFCDYPLCHKSYGTITHLNTHRISKSHGQRMTKQDFYYMQANVESNIKEQQ